MNNRSQSEAPKSIALLQSLKEMGLLGIEAYYTGHTNEQRKHYLELANRHGLLVTGGSDFHGEFKPQTKLGRGRGNLWVPIDLYYALGSHD